MLLYVLFTQAPWGGDETGLLLRADCDQKLNLAQFETLKPGDAPPKWTQDRAQRHVDLSSAEIDHLVKTLCSAQFKHRSIGLQSAAIVRRLRANQAPPQPKETAQK